MMKEALKARLIAETGLPVAWGLSPRGTSEPRITLTTVGGDTDYTHDGPSGLREARVQVDCFGQSYGEAEIAARAVTAALSGWGASGITVVFKLSERDTVPSAETGIFRSSADYRVLYQEVI